MTSGIAYDAVPPSLTRLAVAPGDEEYDQVRSTYVRTGSPGLVLRPDTVDGVVDALAFARAQQVPLAVRSGGHSLAGKSTNDGGVVINLSRHNRVEVLDPATGLVRVGPGARWSHVAEVLRPYGLVISSGDNGAVGVGGLATVGGIGFLDRGHGLTIDHLVAAEVVLADGRIVRADADNHPDLFWALRGAGGNVGIVTSFELSARPVRDVVFAQLVYDASDLPRVLERWGEEVEQAPRALTSFLYAGRHHARVIAVHTSPDDDVAVEALTPFLAVGPVVRQSTQRLPYAAVVHADEAPYHGSSSPSPVSNGFVTHLTEDLTGELADAVRSGVSQWLAIRAVGGAVNDVAASATAFAHRDQNFNVSDVGTRRDGYLRHWDRMRKHTSGLYINFETDDRPQRLHDAYPDQTLARLRRIKAAYDPDNVFNQNFPIS